MGLCHRGGASDVRSKMYDEKIMFMKDYPNCRKPSWGLALRLSLKGQV
jgi:hypothetical protein